MKTNALLLVVVAVSNLHAQGTFQNLDFESATPPFTPVSPNLVSITNALPGWTSYYQGNPINGVWYNNRPLDEAGTALYDPASPSLRPIQGNYSVLLIGSTVLSPVTSAAAIGQTGQIPITALSLQYFATLDVSAVTFNGQPIPTFKISDGAGYSIFGGDISSYAGQTGELRFTAYPSAYPFAYYTVLDNIQFSNQAVPEPGVLALSVVGGLLLGWRLRRR